MGKNNKKKRKQALRSHVEEVGESDKKSKHGSASSPSSMRQPNNAVENPLLERQAQFMREKVSTDQERYEFFSPEISSERRAELWMAQADLGEDLINKYSWATPDSTAIRILKEFSPLVEIGCGSNAYWCRILRQAGVDIVGYDVNISSGGKIDGSSKKETSSANNDSLYPAVLKQGGPEVLSSRELQKSGRTLFLCYPDEEDEEMALPQEAYDDDGGPDLPTSMGWRCLSHYSGQYVIHVGETFLDANLGMDQAPWGRSSAPEFQQRLASEYHCLLKVELPNWLHARDSISVWKRSSMSTMVFAADNEDEGEDEEVEYRHIPRDERLPVNVAAPCLAHLLPVNHDNDDPALLSKGQGSKEPTTPTRTADRIMSTYNNRQEDHAEKHDGRRPESTSSSHKKKTKKRKSGESNKSSTSATSPELKNTDSYDWGEMEEATMPRVDNGEYATPW